MPFKSEKQRRFMYSQHPEIAKRWSKEMARRPDNATKLQAAAQKRLATQKKEPKGFPAASGNSSEKNYGVAGNKFKKDFLGRLSNSASKAKRGAF